MYSSCPTSPMDAEKLTIDMELHTELERLQQARKRSRLVTFALVLCTNLATIAAFYLFVPHAKSSLEPRPLQGVFSYKFSVPEFLSRPELFEWESRTIVPAPLNGQASWTHMPEVEESSVWIEDPDRYRLPPGLAGGSSKEHKVYGFTWGHQVHCVMMIRNEYEALKSNKSRLVHQSESLDASERYRSHHIDHCFHYLAETIRCNRDMNLEWMATYPNELGMDHVDGYYIPRQCRKTDAIADLVAEHQAPI